MIALNKYYISISLLLILNTSLFSKDSLHTALQIGGNLSSIYDVNMSGGYIAGNGNFLGYDPSNKLGLNLGYYLSYPINNYSDLNVELWFIQKGIRGRRGRTEIRNRVSVKWQGRAVNEKVTKL